MIKICASCHEPKEAYVFSAEGPLCHDCLRRASTRIETIWIDGAKYHVCLKGVEKKLVKTRTPAVSAAGVQ